jgi:hypothetical protein
MTLLEGPQADSELDLVTMVDGLAAALGSIRRECLDHLIVFGETPPVSRRRLFHFVTQEGLI